MKKILALLLAMVMVFALCACGSSDSAATEDTSEATTEVEEPAVEADAAAPAAEAEAPAEEVEEPAEEPADDAGASGEMSDASGEMASGESGEEMGAQAGTAVDLDTNEHIPTADDPETYTADEDGYLQYMMDCAYYAMGTSDSDNKLGATYYDILNGTVDMFVNMWGVDDQDTFLANGGVPTVEPWTLSEGTGTPETVPDSTDSEA